MDEIEIVNRISELVEDVHALEGEHAGTPPSDEEVARLRPERSPLICVAAARRWTDEPGNGGLASGHSD